MDNFFKCKFYICVAYLLLQQIYVLLIKPFVPLKTHKKRGKAITRAVLVISKTQKTCLEEAMSYSDVNKDILKRRVNASRANFYSDHKCIPFRYSFEFFSCFISLQPKNY